MAKMGEGLLFWENSAQIWISFSLDDEPIKDGFGPWDSNERGQKIQCQTEKVSN